MQKLIILFLFFGVLASIGAQDRDVKVVLSEGLVNKFLASIGNVSKTEPFKILGTQGEYTWTVKNPRLKILQDRAQFTAGASIDVKGFRYDTEATGEVEVKYDQAANKIRIKILKTVIKIYLEILGQKKDIAEIDVSKYYNFQFEFAGPEPFQKSIDVAMPDKSIKTIGASVVPVLALEPGQIVVAAEIRFEAKKK